MSQQSTSSITSLFEEDETAWLEQMSALVSEKRWDEIDHNNLREFLWDMAKRDRRKTYNRLVVLLSHLLKWEHQPDQRSNSWRGTIIAQRRKLRQLLESETLRRHATASLQDAHKDAVEQAAAETGLREDVFPSECVMTLDEVLGTEVS